MPTDPRTYTFRPPDRLYTDHLGRRVVADWEGDGQLRAEIDGGVVWLISEGVPVILTDQGLSFEGFALVVADEEAFTHIDIGAPLASPPRPQVLLDAFDIDDLAGLKARNWRVQNISERVALESTFANGTARVAATASHLNAAHWTLSLPGEIEALILRKTYDQFHGRQRARVLIDGELVGMWYEPVEDRTHRWAARDFIVPGSFLTGKSAVTITIDPPSGTPLWSVSRMEMWSATL